MSIEITVNAKHVFTDEDNRLYHALLDPKQVEDLYLNLQRSFWRDRNDAQSHDYPEIIQQQGEDYLHGTKFTLSNLIQRLVEEVRSEGRSNISVLELGCANGITLRHLAKTAGDLDVQFVGLELTACLVDDLKKNFPDAQAYVGGAEELISMSEAELGSKSFDAFIVSGVLCQMPPDIVLKVLNHVSLYCDTVLMWDYLMNLDGELSSEYPVIFKHIENASHFLFAHSYRALLRDAGFNIEEIQHHHDEQGPENVPGEGALVAKKSAGKANA